MKTISLVAFIAILFAAACNRSSTDQLLTKDISTVSLMEVAAEADSVYTSPQIFADEKVEDHIADNTNKSPTPIYQDWDKKLIKTANITIDAANYFRFDKDVRNALKKYGAYIASEEQAFSDYKKQNQVTIKVPVIYFESLLGSFDSDSNRIVAKNVSTSDVKAEMYDSKSRIEARKKIRERYVELLQQAKKMDDVLKVEQEINQIQEELESAAGRLNYLSHQTSYSTIHLTYYSLLTVSPKPEKPSAIWPRIKEGFVDSGNILLEIILVAIRLWPLILLGILIGLLWKRRRLQVIKK